MFDIKGILEPITAIINKVVPDKSAAAAAQAQLALLQAQGELNLELSQLAAVTANQSDINKIEAANPSLFVSGWRPGAGWACVAALVYQFLVKPLLGAGFVLAGHAAPELPGLDDNLFELLFGLLGMGGLRTVEKIKGVAAR